MRGVEWYQGGGVGGPNARTHVVYAFLRNVVGSMDYTPVAFEAGLAGRDLPYGHSLALAVLFESGLVHFADRADGSVDEGFGRLFDRFPFARPFFEQVPTVWDDTRLLAGDPEAGFVVLARRAGARWYVAGIHAHDEPFVLALDLSSLTGGGPAEPTCLGTGAAPDSLVESTPPVAASGSLSLSLAARDGFVCWLEP